MAQWLEHCPVPWKVVDSIPGESTCQSCGFGPWLGCIWRQLTDVSLSHRCFSISFPLPLKSMNVSLGADLKSGVCFRHRLRAWALKLGRQGMRPSSGSLNSDSSSVKGVKDTYLLVRFKGKCM